jgi:hypothetical protein
MIDFLLTVEFGYFQLTRHTHRLEVNAAAAKCFVYLLYSAAGCSH